MNTQFTEVKCTFFDENRKWWCVDAWRTDDPNEDGEVVATIREETLEVFYQLERYKKDEYVHEVIREKLHELTSVA